MDIKKQKNYVYKLMTTVKYTQYIFINAVTQLIKNIVNLVAIIFNFLCLDFILLLNCVLFRFYSHLVFTFYIYYVLYI